MDPSGIYRNVYFNIFIYLFYYNCNDYTSIYWMINWLQVEYTAGPQGFITRFTNNKRKEIPVYRSFYSPNKTYKRWLIRNEHNVKLNNNKINKQNEHSIASQPNDAENNIYYNPAFTESGPFKFLLSIISKY